MSAEVTELCPVGDWQIVIEIGEKAEIYVGQFWLVCVNMGVGLVGLLFCHVLFWRADGRFVFWRILNCVQYKHSFEHPPVTDTLQLLNYHIALRTAYTAKS